VKVGNPQANLGHDGRAHRGRSTNPLLLANPNDEDATSAITLLGRGPGRRAGHSATAVGRFIYIFGGSCGPDYLNDFFVLDTDPSPTPQITEPTSLQLLQSRMQKFVNEEEFSDVTFVLEGGAHRIYGHKMILCLVSDCFRAMFTTGFRESTQREIEIPNCSYGAFHCMMQYIYTGRVPDFAVLRPTRTNGSNDDDHDSSPSIVNEENLNRAVEVLELADQFFLDHLKQCCERMLQAAVRAETCDTMLQVAQKCNAHQLEKCCRHYLRNDAATPPNQQQLPAWRESIVGDSPAVASAAVAVAAQPLQQPPAAVAALAVSGRMDTDEDWRQRLMEEDDVSIAVENMDILHRS